MPAEYDRIRAENVARYGWDTAVLELLGRTTWILPRWLERRLPQVAIEPEQSPKPRATLDPVYEAGS